MKNIEVDLAGQRLFLYEGTQLRRTYDVSTARNGPGEMMDSECTPRGHHVISEKIGAGCAENAVFVGRRPTGEIYTPQMRELHPNRDWILTRILWLCGTERGRNLGGRVDTKDRYIYIHGTPDDTDIRVPGSHGCIRLRNADVIELFDLVDVGTAVHIIEGPSKESP